ncbi:DUF4145 domain-containing protein [Sorangium sp. So ce124]|uniref:DUF4145 domain-containing protein n=1 Tax=Sorangium sp. So ce124 TaxID=3133280 RepID=UPI003F60AB26
MAITMWCPHCESLTQVEIIGRTDFDAYHYAFGKCVGCSCPGLVELDCNDPSAHTRRQVFPSTGSLDCDLPAKVNESYQEAIRCQSAGAWIATAVMVRRTLEAIGREFDPKSKRLVDGLKSMREQGAISDELLQWGEELRFLGNIGAHPTDDIVTSQDAEDAVEFVSAIIETIYHLRPKFQAMRERRKKAKGGGDT